MEKRLYFVMGDLLSNGVMGATGAAAAAWAAGRWGWGGGVGMVAGMVFGMVASMVWAPLWVVLFGALEIMLPGMLAGMLGGMIGGMLPAHRGIGPEGAWLPGATAGWLVMAGVYGLNRRWCAQVERFPP
ncbi:MAG: hypothetical protein HQL51_15970 [Magnetococcales bacterium]|nr:hypothetical protein [Magnetococcales bacterium]